MSMTMNLDPQTHPEKEAFFTQNTACKYLGVSVDKIKALVEAGDLHVQASKLFPTQKLFLKSELEPLRPDFRIVRTNDLLAAE